jgi:hypothetical protein
MDGILQTALKRPKTTSIEEEKGESVGINALFALRECCAVVWLEEQEDNGHLARLVGLRKTVWQLPAIRVQGK